MKELLISYNISLITKIHAFIVLYFLVVMKIVAKYKVSWILPCVYFILEVHKCLKLLQKEVPNES